MLNQLFDEPTYAIDCQIDDFIDELPMSFYQSQTTFTYAMVCHPFIPFPLNCLQPFYEYMGIGVRPFLLCWPMLNEIEFLELSLLDICPTDPWPVTQVMSRECH